VSDDIDTFHTPVQSCLKCGKEMSAATSVKGKGAPTVGSATVCLYCGHLMEFGVGLILQEPSDQMIVEIAGDKYLLKAQQISGLYRKLYKP